MIFPKAPFTLTLLATSLFMSSSRMMTTAFSPVIIFSKSHRVGTMTSQSQRQLLLQPLFVFGNKQQQQQKEPRKGKQIRDERRKQLGIADDEDEYDLEMALNNNTDPFITKAIAGSLIVAIMSLLVVGVVIPITTDYGDGVCNALLTGGRC